MLNKSCQCDLSSSITDAEFRCFPASPNAVTFRARISSLEEMAAGHLEEWTRSGALVSVQGQMLRVDRSCSIRISSFGDEECQSSEETMDEDYTIYVIVGVAIPPIYIIILSIAGLVSIKRKKTTNRKPQGVSCIIPLGVCSVINAPQRGDKVRKATNLK